MCGVTMRFIFYILVTLDLLVIVKSGDIKAEEEENSIKIKCLYKASFIYWEWKPLNKQNFTPIVDLQSSDKNRYSGFQSKELTIISVSNTVFGKYRCKYYSDPNIQASNRQFSSALRVGKPEVSIKEKNTIKAKDSSVTIICIIQSLPKVTEITWERKLRGNHHYEGINLNGGHVTVLNSSKGSELHISKVWLNDTGTYMCKGSHKYGNGSANATLEVGSPPSVSFEVNEYVAKVGNYIVIKCHVSTTNASNVTFDRKHSSSTPFATQWKTNVLHGVQEFQIENITIDLSGDYECRATNIFGNGNDSTKLVVLSARITGQSTGIKRNMNVKWQCATEGEGVIVWRKNKKIIYSNSHLNLMKVNRTHSGNYTCAITYRNKTAESAVVPLRVKDIPLVGSNSHKIESFVGNKVIVHCDYDKESQPSTVSWMHNNESLSFVSAQNRYSGGNVTMPSLTINEPRPLDSGDYVCNVTNEIGSGYSDVIKVLVKVPKQLETNNADAVGGVIAVIIILILIAVLVVWFRKRRVNIRERSKSTQNKTNTDNDDVQYSRVKKRNVQAEKLYANTDSLTIEKSSQNVNRTTSEVGHTDNGLDSTYYNAFEASKTRIKVTDLKNYLKKKDGDALRDEFKDVPYGILHPINHAQAAGNKPKNRYKTTFPYDHTRVVLRTTSSKSDYINASYIDGFDHEKQYIACQGPITTTLTDHWKMIWQENIRQIIMLTNLVEGMKVKCEQYWPGETGQMKTGPFRLSLLSEKERATFVTREIDVYNKEVSQNRRVVQYHFTAWPDHGTPNPLDLVAFYRHVIADEKKRDIPVLVHCSAGIGRTGTYIGLDAMTKKGNTTGYIDIFSYLKQMRYCRMNMIQTADQYLFLHQTLLEMFSVNAFNIAKDRFGLVWDDIQADREPINNQRLFTEFKMLQSIIEETAEKPAFLKPVDAKKNRNKNVVPLQSSRLFLVSYERGRSDYINAVAVPSFTKQRGYLVTQLPLPETTTDFWTMMFDHGSQTIVLMLENEDEANMVYTSGSNRVEKGPFVIDVTDKDESGYGVVKVGLKVTRKGDENLTVNIYQVLCNGVFESKHLCGLMESVLKLWKTSDLPITVVSSDGSRNCGLFCIFANAVCSMLMDDSADIFHLARVAKLQQPEFLSTYDEYKRCYEALYVYLDSTSNIYANA